MLSPTPPAWDQGGQLGLELRDDLEAQIASLRSRNSELESLNAELESRLEAQQNEMFHNESLAEDQARQDDKRLGEMVVERDEWREKCGIAEKSEARLRDRRLCGAVMEGAGVRENVWYLCFGCRRVVIWNGMRHVLECANDP